MIFALYFEENFFKFVLFERNRVKRLGETFFSFIKTFDKGSLRM